MAVMPARRTFAHPISVRDRILSLPSGHALLHGLTLVALVPITVILGARIGNLVDDPILGVYGLATLLVLSSVMFVAFARYRDVSLTSSPPEETPLVSILVAVKDEREVVERCIWSLLTSTYPRCELIAVDDGSTDGTAERLERLAAANPRMHLIRLPESVGKKRALAQGAAVAEGDYLVFTDSDCVVDPDAIDRVMSAFASDPDIGAVSGHARALNADRNFLTKMQDTWYEGQFSIWKGAESVFGAVTCISGPLAAFRREAIYNYFPAWVEDRFLGQEFRFATDRQLTAYVLGSQTIGAALQDKHAESPFVSKQRYAPHRWRIAYVKSARAHTVVPHTLGRLTRQQVRWKKSFLRNLCFTGTFYWRKGVMPSVLFYGHALFVLATPFMAARHLIYMPLHGKFTLAALYLVGVFFKGSAWAAAYKIQNPKCTRWVYRPFMSVMTSFLFSLLLVYSALTIRRSVWARG